MVISGCSGGGKSTLLSELERRGNAVVEEPGRRIVHQELEKEEGKALPWNNPKAFARCAIEMAIADRLAAAEIDDWVFFDRGLIDASAALEHLTGTPVLQDLAKHHPYYHTAFLTPPWPEIYSQDIERQHDFDEAVSEYSRLLEAYSVLGYQIEIIPKIGVSERADFILNSIS